MDRAQKQEMITELNGVFNGAAVVVVSHYSGMSVSEMSALRQRMGNANAKVKVIKNRLAKRALEGTPSIGILDLLTGPTVIAYSADPVAAAKAAMEYAKENDKFIIRGGAMGLTVLDKQGVENLASLPSLDELRARLVGMISTPATRIAGVLAAPAGQLARVLRAHADKNAA